MRFSKISKIIDDARRGKMFILVDDEQRENEGDLIIPASKITSKLIKRELCNSSLFIYIQISFEYSKLNGTGLNPSATLILYIGLFSSLSVRTSLIPFLRSS